MKVKFLVLWGGLFLGTVSFAQVAVSPLDSMAITAVLFQQQKDWNNADIDSFMEGYLKSEALVFSGSGGPIYGWENTLARYKKNYGDPIRMGKLQFDVLNMLSLSDAIVQMQGKFYLTREIGDSSGYFTLLWLKKEDQWKILSDHTSSSK